MINVITGLVILVVVVVVVTLIATKVIGKPDLSLYDTIDEMEKKGK